MKKAFPLVLAAAVLLLPGCREERLSVDTESTIPVKAEELKAKGIQEFVTATGTAFAVRDVPLKTEQAGRYRLCQNPRTGRPFRMRDAVRKGEILVALENPEFANQTAIESRKLQKESAEREFTKQRSVHEKGGITLKELTDAEKAFLDANYAYENAALALKKLEVRAPFDGILVDLPHISEGRWVETNTLVAEVMDYARLYADLTLPGKDMDRLAQGQRVVVSDYGQPGISLSGVLTQFSPALDPESRMFKFRIEIPNPGLRLKPGSFIKAEIVVREKAGAFVLPKSVILDRRGAKTVFVVERGIALERRIQTGIENVDEVEVADGLKAGERVVVEGFETLRDRTRVKIVE
ncbi:MAG: efflux RND transporter periplasmic adaptor subunit [Candidatus Aminicenantes bacterium]|nr:efflux RND transporter periplasmic adaptor subunit [Candidatus Aminicenantes bacterium]